MIHPETHKLFTKYLKAGLKVIEFGNNGVNINAQVHSIPHPNGTGGVIGKISNEYYPKHYKIEMVSLDINGLNGAWKVDLSKPVKHDELQGADIVTDLGTTEHIKNLYGAFKNAFNMCKVGGLMMHANPETGSFANHGFHWFGPEFWKAYRKAANLDIIEMGRHQAYPPRSDNDGWEVFCVLKKKKDSKFPTKAVFEQIRKKYVFAK
jgi:hypothetical protein